MNQLSLAGTALEHFHVCAFFNSRDEEYDVLNPFFKEGIDQGEKNLHIVNPAHAADHRARLGDAGIDVHRCEACGQLEILPWQNAYLSDNGTFNKHKMLAMVDHVTSKGLDAGYKRVRIMGDMDWMFSDVPGAADIIQYECEVNEVLTRNRQPAVCVYDISKLSGAMMMDILRTHPLSLIDGVVQENPFFTPPEEMLRELDSRKSAGTKPFASAA
ncbi:MAG: MEDS domain-containing protein [Burkholderiaceae bacterium]